MFTGVIIVLPTDDMTRPATNRRPDERATDGRRRIQCEEASSETDNTKTEDNTDGCHG